MRKSNYDKFPFVAVPGAEQACVVGWTEIGNRLKSAIAQRATKKTVVIVECYPGVDERAVLAELKSLLNPALAIHAAEAMYQPKKIDALVAPFLGGDDPVFGFLSGLALPNFFDIERLWHFRNAIADEEKGIVLVVGCGASLIAWGGILIYADLARWEAQMRFRRNESSNLGVENCTLAASLQYKRAFFVDWRMADRWKRPLIKFWDFVLDTNNPREPKLADGEAVREGLRQAVKQPFRVVPFFDPAPWGGQWMKEFCDLDRSAKNYGWCFDCVPEENSLLLGFGDTRFEIPSIDLVFNQPRALLGERVHARFGDEFPIRFDFLDTMGGGQRFLKSLMSSNTRLGWYCFSGSFSSASTCLTRLFWSEGSKITKSRPTGVRSPSRRRMRVQKLWKVLTHIWEEGTDTSRATRSRISSAALLVKVMARMEPGCTPSSSMSQAMRRVITVVLPEPAPARMSSGPWAC